MQLYYTSYRIYLMQMFAATKPTAERGYDSEQPEQLSMVALLKTTSLRGADLVGSTLNKLDSEQSVWNCSNRQWRS
jgi:hypothetical protein